MSNSQKAGFFLGLVIFLLILFLGKLDPAKPEITKMAAVAALMAVWWITEAIPLAATSLLPIVLFPLLGILSENKTAGAYINSTIFLFFGGFLLAIAMEKWGLHKRIALKIIMLFGGSPNSIVIGFMAASAFISMWISNTATAVMMLPIGLAIIHKMENEFGQDKTKNFSVTLMLAIAYSCSIGGIATLIGTPPNLSFIRIYQIIFPRAPEISFGQWLILGLPIALLMLSIAAVLLTKVFYKIDKRLVLEPGFIKEEYHKLGIITFEEKVVTAVFSLTALLWIFRADLNLGFINIPGWQNIFSKPDFINDGTVAVGMAMILFLIPSKQKPGAKIQILDNHAFMKVPWGIILLFGGGFALATGFTSTGLSNFIGKQFLGMSNLSPILMIIIVATVINLLTQLTSNTATAEMILPIMASVSVAISMNPLLLMLTATLSASMGFMMPAATPPNTIVFASERLKISEMARAGFALSIAGIIVVSLLVYLIGSFLFDLNTFPLWAK
jgi:solute carrier family 13 (sodium-dependent dicarboxylate transporter), member 2/3/5